MQSSNKSLNLDAYDNTSAYKAHGHKIETVKAINLCINMYIVCSKWNGNLTNKANNFLPDRYTKYVVKQIQPFTLFFLYEFKTYKTTLLNSKIISVRS